jgi:hypothetical protein
LGLLWAFLGFFSFSEYNLSYYWRSYYHVDVALAGLAIIVEIIAGMYFFTLWVNKTLRIIEEKGVFELTRRFLIYYIGAFIVACALIIWSVGKGPQSTLIYILDFMVPIPAAGFLTRAAAYWRCQKRNKTIMYAQSGVFIGQIYPYPPLTKVDLNQAVAN